MTFFRDEVTEDRVASREQLCLTPGGRGGAARSPRGNAPRSQERESTWGVKAFQKMIFCSEKEDYFSKKKKVDVKIKEKET